MTTSRAKMLILGVWTISFVICFPPLVGWNTSDETTMGYIDTGNCSPQCSLSSDPGYVVYSAVGSFFAPMLVMIFFNWRIYRTAKRTTKAIRQGFTRVKNGSTDIGGMGIHRGRTTRVKEHLKLEKDYIELTTFTSSNRGSNDLHNNTLTVPGASGVTRVPGSTFVRQNSCARSNFVRQNSCADELQESYINGVSVINGNGRTKRKCIHLKRSFSDQETQTTRSFLSKQKKPNGVISTKRTFLSGRKTKSGAGGLIYTIRNLRQDSRDHSDPPSPTSSLIGEEEKRRHSTNLSSNNKAFAKRNIKSQVRKFRMETKAAKTIGIIVGCFVICWLPFFTIYIGRVWCQDCVPSLVFSIFFWLGYCNSAINPFIYALFARDFRNAFKKILCKVFCKNIS